MRAVNKRIFSKLIFDANLSENESLRAALDNENPMKDYEQETPRESLHTEKFEPKYYRRMLTSESPR